MGLVTRQRISPALRGGARGVVAAMAMTGLRQVTTGFGYLPPHNPPEAVLCHLAMPALKKLKQGQARALIELLHWSYGSVGGVLFGLLPRRWRRKHWIGPAYGFLFWLVFETLIAPRLSETRWQSGSTRLALIGDHVLYGAVVAASAWPHAD